MSLSPSCFKALQNEGLVIEYYCATDFSLCLVANWSIMAIDDKGEVEYDSDGPDITYYPAWHIDTETAKALMENNALFTNIKANRKSDLDFYGTERKKLIKIRDEIANGTRESMIDEEFKKPLLLNYKKWYIEENKAFVESMKDVRFSDKKFSHIMLSFLLYPLGLPWFLTDKTVEGVIQLAVMLISSFLPFLLFPLLPLLIGHAIFLFVQLLRRKVKDKKGYIIATKGYKNHVATTIKNYNDYRAELGEYN